MLLPSTIKSDFTRRPAGSASLNDRMLLAKRLLAADGVFIAKAIDDEQQRELSFLLADNFDGRLLGTICVRANPSGRPHSTGYSVSPDTCCLPGSGPTQSVIPGECLRPSGHQSARFSQRDEEAARVSQPPSRRFRAPISRVHPALYYPIYIRGTKLRVPNMAWDEQRREWRVLEDPVANEAVVWPNNEDGVEKTWRWEWQTVMSSLASLAVRPDPQWPRLCLRKASAS